MKKIVALFSITLLMVMTSCGSSSDTAEEIYDEDITLESEVLVTDDEASEELSEEEIQALFDDMMRQVEQEMNDMENTTDWEISPEMQQAMDEMLLIDESGELNPGLVDE